MPFRRFVTKTLQVTNLEDLFKVFARGRFTKTIRAELTNTEWEKLNSHVVDAFLNARQLAHLRGQLEELSLYELGLASSDDKYFREEVFVQNAIIDVMDAKTIHQMLKDLRRKRNEYL